MDGTVAVACFFFFSWPNLQNNSFLGRKHTTTTTTLYNTSTLHTIALLLELLLLLLCVFAII